MKFTLSWLKDHLDTEASLNEITDALTMLGLELEGVEDRAEALKPFTICKVIEAKQHPNADRLRVCLLDTGTEKVQVVCGAPNARTGMTGVFAPIGAHIPGTGIDLKKGKIRGEESNGMLCSEREMMLSEDHDGIIDLPDEAPLGASFVEYAGLGDPVIDIAITPNRGDCLGVRGVARDLAALGIGTLKPLGTDPVKGTFKSPMSFDIQLDDENKGLCPLVSGRYFKGVKNGPSPKWMQDRLTAVGLRPISALVDITNYVMLDVGRPLHAYDANKVDGDIIIRQAKDGESYTALNGKEYTFDNEMLVLGDKDGVDDLAGIMGGERTGCADETTEMFLEVAIFDPKSVAATARKLNILSDARYRFERGLDQTGPYWGNELATKLVLDICGGEASEMTVSGPGADAWKREIPLRHSRIAQLCGVEVEEAEAQRILGVLGFEVSGSGESMSVTPPPWRPDIDGEADLVEEVVRVHGYDRIEAVSMTTDSTVPAPALTAGQKRRRIASRVLASRGMMEAVTFSFLSRKQAELFGGGGDDVTLVNPISADLDVMRPSVLPNLIDAAARNANLSMADAAIFEVGPQYGDDTPKGQVEVACGLRAGNTSGRDWTKTSRPVDAFDAKADALALMESLGAPTGNLQVSVDAPSWYHPGRSGTLRLGPNVLAWFGEVHPKVLRAYDIKGPVVAFELFIEKVPMPKSKGGKARPLLKLNNLQPVSRDFAFIVDQDVTAEGLIRSAKGADKALITDVSLFDEYAGKGIEDGKKSLAIAITLTPTDATLTDEQIDAVADKVVANVTKHCGGELRG